jgi:aryl sulfotransferase
MPDTPTRRRRYIGGLTDTDRWDHFIGRPGDVFVSTPPKCGTTWTTSIVTMLCHGTTDVVPTKLVQWIDATLVPLDEAVRSLAAQDHRRCIKSHTPFDGMPYFRDAAYIAVYRHPLDMMFSHRKHTANSKSARPDHPYRGDADASLRFFVEQALDFEAYDDSILEAAVRHFRSFRQTPVPDNVLVIHYADLLRDARKVIGMIADHMGLAPDPALLDAIHAATSFGKMKAQPDRFAPFADRDYWHDSGAFFDSGGSRAWDGKLSEASLALYRDRINALLSPEDLAWLERGAAG